VRTHTYTHTVRDTRARARARRFKRVRNSVSPCHIRESERAGGVCANGSRRRRVCCAARDAVGGIRGSGLVGTCYDGVMVVKSSDHLVDRRRITARSTVPSRGRSQTVECTTVFQFQVERRVSRALTKTADRNRGLPSDSARTRAPSVIEDARKICQADRFYDLGVYLFKAHIWSPISRYRDNEIFFIIFTADLNYRGDYSNRLYSKAIVRSLISLQRNLL